MSEARRRRGGPAPAAKSPYGVFLEDINFGFDGGLNANLVRNYRFDGVWCKGRADGTWSDPLAPDPAYPRVEDPLRYWVARGADLSLGSHEPPSGARTYGRLVTPGGGVLANNGYSHGFEPAIWVECGEAYELTVQARSKARTRISARVVGEGGVLMTGAVCLQASPTWAELQGTLVARESGRGTLELHFEGAGTHDVGYVSLERGDWWGRGDPKWEGGKWRCGHLRRDIVESLAALHPSFVRFPGGCIVEGMTPGNEYRWKDTVGPLWARRAKENLWGAKVSDGGYCQSYQIGLYELLCLCEDLGSEPLPTLWAGLTCQFRSVERLEVDDPEFRDVVDDYVDLLEFANGDPDEGHWAALRRDMGHPEPFAVRILGIGNENHGRVYHRNFAAIRDEVRRFSPDVRCVMSAYPVMRRLPLAWASRAYAFLRHRDVMVDEHSYQTPEWFYGAAHRYDRWLRGGPGVYVGEFSANRPSKAFVDEGEWERGVRSANAEAAFLTGVERNSDLVEMVSFAPLLNNLEFSQWARNLIDFDATGVRPTLSYSVYRLFSNHVGARRLGWRGRVPRDVFMSATADEGRVYVKLVNASREPRALRIGGLALSGARLVSVRTDGADAGGGAPPWAERDLDVPPGRGLPITLDPLAIAVAVLELDGANVVGKRPIIVR